MAFVQCAMHSWCHLLPCHYIRLSRSALLHMGWQTSFTRHARRCALPLSSFHATALGHPLWTPREGMPTLYLPLHPLCQRSSASTPLHMNSTSSVPRVSQLSRPAGHLLQRWAASGAAHTTAQELHRCVHCSWNRPHLGTHLAASLLSLPEGIQLHAFPGSACRAIV